MPVPTETISRFSMPVGQLTRYGKAVPILESEERRVVVGRDTAVHEHERVLVRCVFGEHHYFRWEISRRGSTGTHELPERQVQIAILAAAVVVLGEKIVADRPRRIGRVIAHYYHQQCPQLIVAEQGRR